MINASNRRIWERLKEFYFLFKMNRKFFFQSFKKSTLKIISKMLPFLIDDYRFYDKLFLRKLSQTGTFEISGIKILSRFHDLIPIKEVFFDNEYTKLKSFIPKNGETVLDIGAGIGEYTLFASKIIGTEGKVIAIEPNANFFNYLSKNIVLNNCKNIIPIKCAIGDKSGKIKIFKTPFSFGDSIIQKKSHQDYYLVKCKTIDNIVKRLKLKRLDIIKMDVESSEYSALLGSKNVLAKFKPKIVLEIHGIKTREK